MAKHIAANLFEALSKSVLQSAKHLSFSPGDYLVSPFMTASHFYILSKGTVKLIYEDASARPLIIDLYHAGDFFGEMEAIGMKTGDRSIVALTSCEVYQFTRKQFLDLWNNCSEFSRYILYVHCERLIRSGNDKINSECMFLREKVFRIIQNNLNDKNYFMYTKDVLAEMAGVSLRSLNRTLVELGELKLVETSAGRIHLYLE